MAPAFAGGRVAASSSIVAIFASGLRLTQLCFDLDLNGAGEMVLENFLLMDKSVACFKLFITAYRQVHAEGAGMLAFSCFLGLSIHLCTIVIHLYINHSSRARAWVKYPGANENLVRDLLMILAETLVGVCLFADYIGKTRGPWDAEKILHLFGSCLVVLIGFGHMVWIVYKAYTHGVISGAEEQAAGAAMDGGDVEQQRMEDGVEVVGEGDINTAPLAFSVVALAPPVFIREVETAAIEGAGGSDEGGDVPLDEVGEVMVLAPA